MPLQLPPKFEQQLLDLFQRLLVPDWSKPLHPLQKLGLEVLREYVYGYLPQRQWRQSVHYVGPMFEPLAQDAGRAHRQSLGLGLRWSRLLRSVRLPLRRVRLLLLLCGALLTAARTG